MSNITKVSTTVLLCALLLGMAFTTLNFTNTDLTKTDIPPAYGIAAVTDLKCYSTNDPTDPPPVILTDQFGTERIDPGGFPFLCTSTVKNDEGTLGELHWNAYPTTGTLDPPPVTLTDQFGSMLVDPGTAAFLMAPVIKNGAGDLKAPHFKCYNMVGTINPPIVTLADQFVTERVDPFPAVDFCTPALKNGEGTLDAPHLICYAIFGQFVGKAVTVEDQFGTRDVQVGFGVLLYTLADKKLFEGRMTGGGSVTGINAAPGATATVKVTHGFELHCVATQVPNNLQVNWDKGNKFHLESLTTATCSDDASISEVPPVAGFDTYKGTGTGRYNGVSGAMAEWEFTDEGEPGKSDKIVMLKITDAGGGVVLDISGLSLTVGNHQAHAQ